MAELLTSTTRGELMHYRTLGADELHMLRFDRLRELEIERRKLELRQEEVPDETGLATRLAEVDRRIALHAEALDSALDGPDEPDVDEPDDQPSTDDMASGDQAVRAARREAGLD